MTIRKIKEADLDSVLEMMLEFYQSPAVLCHADEAVLRRCLADCMAQMPYLEGYVFEQNEVLAGYSLVAKGYNTEVGGLCVHVEDLYICPEFRGRGIGGEFLHYIVEQYRGVATRVRLEVEPENEGACALYARCGFQELPYRQMIVEL